MLPIQSYYTRPLFQEATQAQSTWKSHSVSFYDHVRPSSVQLSNNLLSFHHMYYIHYLFNKSQKVLKDQRQTSFAKPVGELNRNNRPVTITSLVLIM